MYFPWPTFFPYPMFQTQDNWLTEVPINKLNQTLSTSPSHHCQYLLQRYPVWHIPTPAYSKLSSPSPCFSSIYKQTILEMLVSFSFLPLGCLSLLDSPLSSPHSSHMDPFSPPVRFTLDSSDTSACALLYM